MSRDTSYGCSDCALFKGISERRKAEIPAMLYVPGSVTWHDAAPAVGKDYYAAIYFYRFGCLSAFYLPKGSLFFFFT